MFQSAGSMLTIANGADASTFTIKKKAAWESALFICDRAAQCSWVTNPLISS